MIFINPVKNTVNDALLYYIYVKSTKITTVEVLVMLLNLSRFCGK